MTKEMALYWQELDQALNTCLYFKRDMKSPKAMSGWYIRDGKQVRCEAIWDSYIINGYMRDLSAIDAMPTAFPRKSFKKFLRFLNRNGWQSDWYKPRPRAIMLMKQYGFSEDAQKLLLGGSY